MYLDIPVLAVDSLTLPISSVTTKPSDIPIHISDLLSRLYATYFAVLIFSHTI